MARATGKDHARINLDIWGNDDWLELTPPAQHLYFVLWTSPQLSYCGCGDWHPGRIAAKAKGWTAAAVEAAAAELSRELFLIIDTDTGEFVLRSWVKHDGLWRVPNMAVSMANARADLASRTLRAVVVFEVLKCKAREPDLSGWKRDAVVTLLAQKAIDPATLPPFNPTANPVSNPDVNPTAKGYDGGRANPTANPGPTPAPAPAPTSILQGGLSSEVTHQGAESDEPPPDHCPNHPANYAKPCAACGAARQRRDNFDRALAVADVKRRRAEQAQQAAERRELIDLCEFCDSDGYRLGRVCDHIDRTHQPGRLAALAALKTKAGAE